MQLIKNQKGLSLVEITVALGLMGLMTLVTMKLTQTSKGNEALIKANGEISKTMSLIQSALNNPDNCRSMIGGYQLNGPALPYLQLKLVDRSTVPHTITTVNVLTDNTKYTDFSLDTNAIRLVTNTTFQTGLVADLVIQFKLKQMGQDKTVEKKIPVYVTTDASNNIVSCGPVIGEVNDQAKQKFCESLAGGNVASWTGGKCILKSMDCPYGQIPRSMGKMGDFVCEDITTIVPVTQIFNTSEPPCDVGTNGVSIVSDTNGRLKINCN